MNAWCMEETCKERNYGLDLVRVVACLMVVLMHSPAPHSDASSFLYGSISWLTTPCIGLFFMVSGALLLPCRESMRDFLKHRFGKIVFPVLIWSSVYVVLNALILGTNGNLVRQILSLPFSPQGHGVLWFMYTLAGLYLLSPILSPWLKEASRKEMELVLCLWVVTTSFPFLREILVVREDTTSMYYYFAGFAGYYILGIYLRRYPDAIKWSILVPIAFISLCIPGILRIVGCELPGDAYWYLSLPVVIMTVFCYKLIVSLMAMVKMQRSILRVLVFLSKYSFGVYLVHIAVMRYVLWRFDWFTSISSCYASLLVSFLFTGAVSYLLVWMIGKTKISKYIIGI